MQKSCHTERDLRFEQRINASALNVGKCARSGDRRFVALLERLLTSKKLVEAARCLI